MVCSAAISQGIYFKMIRECFFFDARCIDVVSCLGMSVIGIETCREKQNRSRKLGKFRLDYNFIMR
jgi:hypothetical protein